MMNESAATTIRAEIPGTAILRGDIPAPPLRKVENYRNVYEADFDSGAEIQGVNEQDTLIVLGRAANVADLDFSPGMFYHDRQAKKLYVSPPDMALPPGRRYTVAVTPGPVLELVKPQRVNLEGLTATGAGRRSAGFNLLQPADCAIVNTCTVTGEADRKSRQFLRLTIRSQGDHAPLVPLSPDKVERRRPD